MKAYHYTNTTLEIGTTITSKQSSAKTYNRFFKIYKEVADSLGLELHFEFGYAYPNQKPNINFKNEYVVETESYIKGDFRYSIYASMDLGLPVVNADSLQEKLSLQNEWIRERAKLYFSNDIPEQYVELISGSWIITQ